VQSLLFCVLILAPDLGWTAGTDGVLWTAELFFCPRRIASDGPIANWLFLFVVFSATGGKDRGDFPSGILG
jgi:hypothetical protein